MEESPRQGGVAKVWRSAEGVDDWRGYRISIERLSNNRATTPSHDRKLNLLPRHFIESLWDGLWDGF